MSTLLNIIWIFFGGLGLALGWVISGILCIVFIVTIPFSGACFELAGLTLAPFGKEVVERKHLNNAVVPKPIASTLWIIFSRILALYRILNIRYTYDVHCNRDTSWTAVLQNSKGQSESLQIHTG